MKKVHIYTDGACSGNPGPGGWGAIIRIEGQDTHLKGAFAQTTNNRMELTAAVEALKSLQERCRIDLTTDSQYVRLGITDWIHNWKKNNWRTSARKPVKNVDLWQALDEQAQRHQVQWHWIKGHSGHIENEQADELARQAIEELRENQD